MSFLQSFVLFLRVGEATILLGILNAGKFIMKIDMAVLAFHSPLGKEVGPKLRDFIQ